MKYIPTILSIAVLCSLTGCETSRSLETAQKTQALKPVSSTNQISLGTSADPNVETSFAQSRTLANTVQ